MHLSHLLSALPTILHRTPGDPDIVNIEQDSRRVRPGTLFVARRGSGFDGHRFIPEAIAKGAAAIVVEKKIGEIKEMKELEEIRELKESSIGSKVPSVPFIQVPNSAGALAWLCAAFHGFPARKLVMIGVTGTDGKTTTCNLIHSILLAAGIKAGLISTVNAVIGGRVLDTGLHTTTPDAPDMQRYLAQMVEAGMTHCVLETTSHGLAQHRVTGCEFDIAVVTNITHEHLDFHGSLDNYRAAKAKLFEGLATSYKKPGINKLAVLNADDESVAYLRSRLSVPYVTYGLTDGTAIRASDISYQPDKTCFSITISHLSGLTQSRKKRGKIRARGAYTPRALILPVFSSLVGAHNVSNCLAAIAVGVTGLGLEPETVARGVAALKSVPGRLERFELGQDFIALVDFAHTPNALKCALETARQLSRGKVILVFGSAGLRDVAKRRWMGEIAAELADYAILTAEDPRTESLEAILAEIAAGVEDNGGVEGKTFWRIPDRGEAIRFAVGLAQPGDVVLACGKAHEQSMCFGMTEYPWDDRVALRSALAARLGIAGPPMPLLPTSTVISDQ